jgi:hypothetical protein
VNERSPNVKGGDPLMPKKIKVSMVSKDQMPVNTMEL